MSHRAFDGYTAPQTANGVDGYSTTIKAQSATGTNARGGNLILGSGTGTQSDGYVKIQTGNQTAVVYYKDGYVAQDGYLIIDQITLDGYTISFDGYSLAPTIRHTAMPTPGVDGYTTTIKAQDSTTNPAHGGNLALKSGDGYNGDGYFRDGYVQLYSGSTEQARVVPNKFYMVTGQRINITDINTTPFTVPDGYFGVMVDTSGGAKTINLPANPLRGDAYRIKDSSGNAGANNITVSGNGHNIDGGADATISTNYGSIMVVYSDTATKWLIID